MLHPPRVLGILSLTVFLAIPSADVDGQALTSTPLAARSHSSGPMFHRIEPSESGIHLRYDVDVHDPYSHLYTAGFACGGVATGDLDGDQRPDIVFAGTSGPNRVFINQGDFRFVEDSKARGIQSDDEWCSAVTLVDIDNDGDLDIYFVYYDAVNRLYLNDGKGVFIESAERFGLDISDASMSAAFCDYDRDGDLDVYLVTNRYESSTGYPAKVPEQLTAEQAKYFRIIRNAAGKRKVDMHPRPDRLLRNDSDSTGNIQFMDASQAAGLDLTPRHGQVATWWDFNRDGWPDLYISNDYDDRDVLYQNNGDGTFQDVTVDMLPHTVWFSMGADAGDINNDGWPDLMTADMSATTHYKEKVTMGAMGARLWVTHTDPRQYMRNALFLGTGTERMLEAAYLAGVADTDWTWAVRFADLDCDGSVDLFVTNGMTRNFNHSDIRLGRKDFIGRSQWAPFADLPPRPEQNLAYRNLGDLQFADTSRDWGLAHTGISFAAATADFDQDGDVDLVVVNMDEPISLYRNDCDNHERLSVRLTGTQSNRNGIGARIEVDVDGVTQSRWLRTHAGFKACDEPVVHFGLGEAIQVNRLTIEWPSGVRQEFRDIATGQLINIREESTEIENVASQAKPLFSSTESLSKVQHREHLFNDFRRQPLLPNQLSQLGPAMAWGDIDDDGDDDLYVGGARGFPGQLLINEGNQQLRRRRPWGPPTRTSREEMGVLFFDADGDSDLDLYVVGGGVEKRPGSDAYADELFLNNGRGYFTRAAEGAIPKKHDSGGCVVAADFDRDGDIDLFVAGRVTPGAYPTSPGSRVLINRGNGVFDDGTADRAPALRTIGMATGAIWSDADNDGWLDLLVTKEWGHVTLFINEAGKLEDKSSEAGLAQFTGWWNGISGGDLDRDGDIDYVVTNFGLNTKYHATSQAPALLYYGDIDGSGRQRVIEAEFENGICYPLRGRSCSSHAIPSLKDRFKTYDAFAIAPLNEIYTQLDRVNKLSVNTLESGVLLNDNGRFEFVALPRLAQIAPSFGVQVTELTGDGIPDLILAQNFFGPQPETGRMDGGLSLVLKGLGNGQFVPAAPGESGVVVPGDAKSLTLVDLNNSGRPDLVFGINEERVQSFLHESPAHGQILPIRLNPSAIGARVSVDLSDGTTQTAELYGGSGYLSQSAPVVYFGIPTGCEVERILIRWPDGRTTERSPVNQVLTTHMSK